MPPLPGSGSTLNPPLKKSGSLLNVFFLLLFPLEILGLVYVAWTLFLEFVSLAGYGDTIILLNTFLQISPDGWLGVVILRSIFWFSLLLFPLTIACQAVAVPTYKRNPARAFIILLTPVFVTIFVIFIMAVLPRICPGNLWPEVCGIPETNSSAQVYNHYYLDPPHAYFALNNDYNGYTAPPVLIRDADIATFEVLDDSTYAKDKNHAYYNGESMEKTTINGADSASFSVYKESVDDFIEFAKDKNHVYYNGNIVPSADPQSFTLIYAVFASSSPYAGQYDTSDYQKDSSHVYYVSLGSGSILEITGADPASFQTWIPSGWAKDKNAVYNKGRTVPNADAATFTCTITGCYDKNRQYPYYD